VLVAGGINGLGALSSAEVFDPVTKQWSSAPANMNMARYDHTATLLKDGRVLVAGGTNGAQALQTAEIFNGANWTYTHDLPFAGNDMLAPCANHTATLLPNGKVMLSGGEGPSVAHWFAQGFDVDFSTWQYQGDMQKRTKHTTVLMADGTLMNIGGYDGSNFLNSTDETYFTYSPDAAGFTSLSQRQPVISSVTASFNNGDTFTITSDSANFHGLSEAYGGGAGAMNASFFSPRIYMQQIDNPSGFLMDMTTSLYTLGSANFDWAATVSSITILTPSALSEMPHGWYEVREAANGQFSDGHIVQVTDPRPAGQATAPLGSVLGTSSITWNWNQGTLGSSDGYDIYSSSNNVFIATAAFVPAVTYTQTGLTPNTAISIGVNSYNAGGNSGPLSQSATYYTFASPPTALTILSASFETASLAWNSSNTPGTKFELSMCAGSDFADPLAISTPIAFNTNYTSTSAVLTQLSADTMYYFRVNAMNGAGFPTDYSNHPSTITVGAVNNLTGTAISSASINWAWGESQDNSVYYEIYDVTLGTANPVYISSTTDSSYLQQGLSANNPYSVAVRAAKVVGGSPVYGPYSYSGTIYTLAVPPDPASGNIFVNVSTGGFTANWTTNGNSTWTVYNVGISTDVTLSTSTLTKSTTLNNYMAFDGLQPNTLYYVGVKATNGNDVDTARTLLGSKYTLARPPLSVTPAIVGMSGVKLVWNGNGNPAGTVFEVRASTTALDMGTSYYLSVNPYLRVTGLLTSTSYYFDVAAVNGDTPGVVTSRTQAVPNALTLSGPEGAPQGSVGGTVNPGNTTVIDGFLPDNQEVTLTVPPQTFPAPTDLAIALSTADMETCTPYPICANPVRTVEVAMYSANNAPPQQPVTFTINYDSQHNCQSLPNTATADNLVLARYNATTGQCLPLETSIDLGNTRITATLNYFGVFALVYKTAAADLSRVVVYPNPFYTNRGNGFVTINNLPASTKVHIYTLSGNKIWEGASTTTGMIIWKAVNKSGQLVASGIYLAVIDSPVGKKVVKIAVER
jgi:hypothetical protein